MNYLPHQAMADQRRASENSMHRISARVHQMVSEPFLPSPRSSADHCHQLKVLEPHQWQHHHSDNQIPPGRQDLQLQIRRQETYQDSRSVNHSQTQDCHQPIHHQQPNHHYGYGYGYRQHQHPISFAAATSDLGDRYASPKKDERREWSSSQTYMDPEFAQLPHQDPVSSSAASRSRGRGDASPAEDRSSDFEIQQSKMNSWRLTDMSSSYVEINQQDQRHRACATRSSVDYGNHLHTQDFHHHRTPSDLSKSERSSSSGDRRWMQLPKPSSRPPKEGTIGVAASPSQSHKISPTVSYYRNRSDPFSMENSQIRSEFSNNSYGVDYHQQFRNQQHYKSDLQLNQLPQNYHQREIHHQDCSCRQAWESHKEGNLAKEINSISSYSFHLQQSTSQQVRSKEEKYEEMMRNLALLPIVLEQTKVLKQQVNELKMARQTPSHLRSDSRTSSPGIEHQPQLESELLSMDPQQAEVIPPTDQDLWSKHEDDDLEAEVASRSCEEEIMSKVIQVVEDEVDNDDVDENDVNNEETQKENERSESHDDLEGEVAVKGEEGQASSELGNVHPLITTGTHFFTPINENVMEEIFVEEFPKIVIKDDSLKIHLHLEFLMKNGSGSERKEARSITTIIFQAAANQAFVQTIERQQSNWSLLHPKLLPRSRPPPQPPPKSPPKPPKQPPPNKKVTEKLRKSPTLGRSLPEDMRNENCVWIYGCDAGESPRHHQRREIPSPGENPSFADNKGLTFHATAAN